MCLNINSFDLLLISFVFCIRNSLEKQTENSGVLLNCLCCCWDVRCVVSWEKKKQQNHTCIEKSCLFQIIIKATQTDKTVLEPPWILKRKNITRYKIEYIKKCSTIIDCGIALSLLFTISMFYCYPHAR